MSINYIAYYRVSTKMQDLGLDAQRNSVNAYISKCSGVLIKEYQEKESGKKDDRPELARAIKMCKELGATLIVAKLDRLSRHAKFLFELHDAKLNIVVCDLPELNTLTFGIFATLAQHERELISERTRAALRAKKDKALKEIGTDRVLGYYANGNVTFTDEDREKALQVRRENKTINKNLELASNKLQILMITSQKKGLRITLQGLADQLNEGGYTTARGGKFAPTQVQRLINRITNN